MPVKEYLKGKVPKYVKDTPEWLVFLRWLSQNNIKTRVQLNSVLNAEIRECEKMLKQFAKSREGTNARVLRSCAKKLGFLKLCRDKIAKYL